jgi:hypothetical protein
MGGNGDEGDEGDLTKEDGVSSPATPSDGVLRDCLEALVPKFTRTLGFAGGSSCRTTKPAPAMIIFEDRSASGTQSRMAVGNLSVEGHRKGKLMLTGGPIMAGMVAVAFAQISGQG